MIIVFEKMIPAVKDFIKFTFITKTAYFNSKPVRILNNNDLTQALQQTEEYILQKIGDWLTDGSNWTINKIISHNINIVEYEPLNGE